MDVLCWNMFALSRVNLKCTIITKNIFLNDSQCNRHQRLLWVGPPPLLIWNENNQCIHIIHIQTYQWRHRGSGLSVCYSQSRSVLYLLLLYKEGVLHHRERLNVCKSREDENEMMVSSRELVKVQWNIRPLQTKWFLSEINIFYMIIFHNLWPSSIDRENIDRLTIISNQSWANSLPPSHLPPPTSIRYPYPANTSPYIPFVVSLFVFLFIISM